MVWLLQSLLLFASAIAALAPVNHAMRSEFLLSEPLAMAIHGKSRVVGKQGLFYGVDGTLPYWLFDSQDSPSKDPVLIWIVNGNTISDIEAMALAVGPLCVTPGSVLTDNEYPLNSNANIVLLAHPGGFNIANSSIGDVLSGASSITRFVSLFTEKYPQYSYEQGIQLGAESFAARHVPIFAANLMSTADRPVNISSVILGNAFINPVKQYSSYFTANCVNNSINLGPETCTLLNQSVTTLLPQLEKCQVNPALPFCKDLVSDLQQNTVGPVISDVKNIYGFDINSAGQSRLEVIEAFQNKERSGKVPTNSMFDLYKDPTYLLSLSTDELIQPYEYMVQYILAAGIRMLVYSGENDMVYNSDGIYNWTSALKWTKQKFSVTEGVIYSQENALGTGFVKGGLTFVNVPDSGHLVTMDNTKVFRQMLSGWCHNEPFKTLLDVPSDTSDGDPIASDAALTTTSEKANLAPLLGLSIGVDVRATLEPVIITITSTMTETPYKSVITVFETFFQTRTLNGWHSKDLNGTATVPVPSVAFTTTDTVFILQPTTTTESFFTTLPPATLTVTDTTTVNPRSPITSQEPLPTYTSTDDIGETTEVPMVTIETVPTSSIDETAFFGSRTALNPSGNSVAPGALRPSESLFSNYPTASVLDPYVTATEQSQPVPTEVWTTASDFDTESASVPVMYSTFLPQTGNVPGVLPTSFVDSDIGSLSVMYPDQTSIPMGMPTMSLSTSMGSPFNEGGSAFSDAMPTGQPWDDQTTTIFRTDTIFSTIPSTVSNPAISAEEPLDDDPVETSPPVDASPTMTGSPNDDPDESQETLQWSTDQAELNFGKLHPAPAPLSQPTQLIGPEAVAGHQIIPGDIPDENEDLEQSSDEFEMTAVESDPPRPHDNDQSHANQGYTDDNIFNKQVPEEDEETDWERSEGTWDRGFDDDQDSDTWDRDTDSREDYDNCEEDHYYRSQFLDHISDHIDYAVNRLENGLDISTDSFEQGIDSAVDGVEDTMDKIENGLDFAMSKLRRLGRM